MDQSTLTIIILIAVGVFLVLLEVVIPGGVVGSLGALCLVGAIAYAFVQSAMLGISVAVGSVIFFLIAFWIWLKYLHKIPIAKDIFLHADGRDWHGTDPATQEFLGKTGIAQTTLRPSGFATIDEERVDVVTEGEMIAEGVAIKVIEVEGNRIVVAAADSPTAQEPSDASQNKNEESNKTT